MPAGVYATKETADAAEVISLREENMNRGKIRKAWTIIWCVLLVCSMAIYLNAVQILLGMPITDDIFSNHDFGIFIMSLEIFNVLVVEIAFLFSGRYFLRERDSKTLGKTIWHILFPLVAAFLLIYLIEVSFWGHSMILSTFE